MKSSLIKISIITALFLPLLAEAAPGIPHQFYGSVDFSNGPAPDNLVVEARIGGEVVASTSITDGKYGFTPNLFFVRDPESNRSGEEINFFVSGIDTEQSAVFVNGGYSNKDLTVDGSVGTIEMGEGETIEGQTVAITPSDPSYTNISVGSDLNITISSNVSTNALIEKVQKMESGNVAIFSGKNLLNAYEIKIDSEDDITISITISYDDSQIDEDTISPYWFNGTDWVEISPFSIDKTANKITFEIEQGGTPYAIFGDPVVVDSGDDTTPPASPGGGSTPSTPSGPTPLSEAAQAADTNSDDKIDILDFNALMVNWGKEETGNIADFDNNGRVDIFDFNLLMIYWTG